MEQDGNAEARIFLKPFLEIVGELGHLAGRVVGFARPRHFTEAILEQRRCTIRQEAAFRIDEEKGIGCVGHGAAVLPRPLQLCHFLLERHAAEKIGNPTFDGKIFALIRELLSGGDDRRTCAKRQSQ